MLLLPAKWIQGVSAMPKERFEAELSATRILLVRVPSAESELARWLDHCFSSDGEEPSPSSRFQTTISSVPLDRAILTRPLTQFDGEALARLLRTRVSFAIPIRKREEGGKSFAERVSIGRARNNDIVLRHASVSKFHAWFECSDNNVYFLGGARSTNGTRLNGELVSTEPQAVEDGDQLSFGDVEALCCTAGTFWDGLRAASE